MTSNLAPSINTPAQRSPSAAQLPKDTQPRARRYAAIAGLSVSTMAFVIGSLVLAGVGAVAMAGITGDYVASYATHALTSVAALAFVWVWHRRRGRSLWREVGLTFNRFTLPLLATGIGISGLVTAAMSLVPVLSGDAPFNDSGQMIQWLAGVPAFLTTAFLLQGFPEELLFRGHLQERLRRWTTDGAAIAISALWFGSMHIISNGPINGTQQAYLMAIAAAFGFTAACARHVTGSIWIAVGVHGGFHIWRGLLVPAQTQLHFGAALTCVLGFVAAGFAILYIGKRRGIAQAHD